LNPGPCIYYAMSLTTELSSRGRQEYEYKSNIKVLKMRNYFDYKQVVNHFN